MDYYIALKIAQQRQQELERKLTTHRCQREMMQPTSQFSRQQHSQINLRTMMPLFHSVLRRAKLIFASRIHSSGLR